MIEPSRGRTTTSGPGAPLLLGIGATAALVIAFLIGFQLGSGEQRVRTVIVGASQPAEAGAESASAPEIDVGSRIRRPGVDNELQQAYYANLRQGSWVVCVDGASLRCKPAKTEPVDGRRGFQPPESYWQDLPLTVLDRGTRVYLVGNLEHVWVGALQGPDPHPHGWDRLLGVTLNGSVQFLDLGALPAGDYVVMDRSQNAFNQQGPLTRAAAMTIQSGS